MLEGDLLLFGCLNDFESKLGSRWSLAGPETRVSALLEELSERAPGLDSVINTPFFKVAVNNKVEPLDWVLSDGDTVALLPPVTGG